MSFSSLDAQEKRGRQAGLPALGAALVKAHAAAPSGFRAAFAADVGFRALVRGALQNTAVFPGLTGKDRGRTLLVSAMSADSRWMAIMRRIDKTLNDARALRVARALRARGVESGLGPPTEWMQEVLAGQALVDTLRVPHRPGDAPLLDPAVLAPFVERARDALLALFKECDPAGLIAEEVGDRVVAAYEVSEDYARFYRSAARDLGMLTAEALLFEVVRGVILANDLARATRHRSDRARISVANGRVRRIRRPAETRDATPSFSTIGVGPLVEEPSTAAEPGSEPAETDA